ncbi:MAG TPA: SDR family NAD(P)-dependent oxidoreductase [Mycobacteriales bacterium]|nr:SDR family NAD(P)-dependent oxidoreductase [Mycobacteriales bacterium]
MLDLRNTSSLVTGGASGLGEAAARLLAERGAKVVVADLNDDRGKRVADELGGVYVHADVTDTEQVIEAVTAAEELGPLRTLVTAAGLGWASRTIGKDGEFSSAHDLGAFQRIIGINLVGTFNCIRLAATAMGRTQPVNDDGERGAIVTLASLAAFDGQIGQAAYSASKGGVVGMTLPIARDLAVVGVRLNCVAPGLFDTPIYGEGPASEAFKDSLKRDVLFPKRLGHADELATMIVELLTNSYMNGEVLRVDGGARLQPK